MPLITCGFQEHVEMPRGLPSTQVMGGGCVHTCKKSSLLYKDISFALVGCQVCTRAIGSGRTQSSLMTCII